MNNNFFGRALSIVAIGCTLHTVSVGAEELDPIFTKVKQLVTEQNYSKALEELKWASKEIEKLNAKKIETFFPDSVNGFTGDKINSSAAMGVTNVERSYKRGADAVKVSLTNLGGAAGGLGGLAQLGSMAAMFGGQTGVEQVRISGKTAQLDTTGTYPKLTLFLDSGSMFALEATGKVTADELKKTAEGFKFDELDQYLKGK